MLSPVKQPLWQLTAPLKLLSSSFSCLFPGPFSPRYPNLSGPFVPANLTFHGAVLPQA